MRRPIGITLLAILDILGGIALAIVAFGAYTRFDELVNFLRSTNIVPSDQAPTVPYAFIAFFVVSSVLYLMVGGGLWAMEPWAWTLSVALYSGGLVSNWVIVAVSGLSAVDLVPTSIVSIVVLFYLLSPGVRHAFAD